MQDLHVAGVRRVAVARLRGDLGAAHDLRKRRVLEVGEPRAVLPVGQEQVPQPAPSRLRLQHLHHGRMGVPRPGRGQFLGIHLLGGIHMLVHEGDQTLLEVLGSPRRLEVHSMLLRDLSRELRDQSRRGERSSSSYQRIIPDPHDSACTGQQPRQRVIRHVLEPSPHDHEYVARHVIDLGGLTRRAAYARTAAACRANKASRRRPPQPHSYPHVCPPACRSSPCDWLPPYVSSRRRAYGPPVLEEEAMRQDMLSQDRGVR